MASPWGIFVSLWPWRRLRVPRAAQGSCSLEFPWPLSPPVGLTLPESPDEPGPLKRSPCQAAGLPTSVGWWAHGASGSGRSGVRGQSPPAHPARKLEGSWARQPALSPHVAASSRLTEPWRTCSFVLRYFLSTYCVQPLAPGLASSSSGCVVVTCT